MSRPCSSVRGPKPPIAPKPRLLYEPEERCCLHSRNSIHHCNSGGQILSEEELDQDNEPGGTGGAGEGVEAQFLQNAGTPSKREDLVMDLFCDIVGNEPEEEENVQEEEEDSSGLANMETADSVDEPYDTECHADLVDAVDAIDMECSHDIEPDGCGAGEALADADGLSECDVATYHEVADHYLYGTPSQREPGSPGVKENSCLLDIVTAVEPNRDPWHVDKEGEYISSDQENNPPQCPSPCASQSAEDSCADIVHFKPPLCEDSPYDMTGVPCNMCETTEEMIDLHTSHCPCDEELLNTSDSSDHYQYLEENKDATHLYAVIDTELIIDDINDMNPDIMIEHQGGNNTEKHSNVSKEQPDFGSNDSSEGVSVSSDKNTGVEEKTLNENTGFENTPKATVHVLEEKVTLSSYANIDTDSLCQDTEDSEQLECVSSEDYVEIEDGENDDDAAAAADHDENDEGDNHDHETDTCEEKMAHSEGNGKSDECFKQGSIQPRFRLCSITMPADMDLKMTPGLADSLVFANTSDVFLEDIDFEGHIVPFMEEADVEQDNISDEHIYEEAGLNLDGDSLLAVDRKSIVTRSRSLSGKVPGYVPETVPEETGTEYQNDDYCSVALVRGNQEANEKEQREVNRVVPSCKSRHFVLYPRSVSVEGGDASMSVYEDHDCSLGQEGKSRSNTNNISLNISGSSGSFSQRSHLPSSGMSTPTSLVDIPPPFELAYITKKPITKSSPSLLIESDTTDKQKKKSSFKRFLALKFRKKRENKVHLDMNVASSRSSSESSYQGPGRVLDMDRRSTGSSPQAILRSGKPQRSSESPSTFLFYKDGRRKGTPKTFNSRRVSRVESFEDRSRPPFTPLPLTKPRSISFPNADTSDYENIPAISSDYENIQIPQRRPTRVGAFADLFDDPCRALSSANENDGYVDMSSFAGFESKPETPQQESERGYAEPHIISPMLLGEPEKPGPEDDQGRTSEEEDGGPDHSHDRQNDGRTRAFYIVKALLDSEKVHVQGLKLLQEDFRAAAAAVVVEDGGATLREETLSQILGQLGDVYELHSYILEELESRVGQWEESQKIADVFLSRRAEFAIFTPYIAKYDRGMVLLDNSCQRSPAFSSVVRQFESSAAGNVTVKHQLLQVIIRVLQYRMLLTDYLNNLSPDSTEYENTQAALSIVAEAADQANENLKEGENLLRLVHIDYSTGVQRDLLQPGRVFVKEGSLMKVSRKSRQPRHLFLMNDILLYTFPQQDGKYRLKNTLTLTGMKVSKPIIENVQNTLKIEVDDITIILSASSLGEQEDWFHTLSRTVEEHSRGHSAFGTYSGEARERLWMSLGEKAPTLVPTSHVMMCMNCTSDFSLTLRRHHCHACGKIVCKGCSRNKYPLKYLKDRLAKVCDHCYAELKKQGGDVVDVSGSASPRTTRSSRPLSAVFQNIHPPNLWRTRKTTATINHVTVDPEGPSTSGTLNRCKRSKRNWKRLWFLIKDKDKIASESLPLLGFTVKLSDRAEGEDANSVFQLYHRKALYCTFKTEDNKTAQRWINAIEEATVL